VNIAECTTHVIIFISLAPFPYTFETVTDILGLVDADTSKSQNSITQKVKDDDDDDDGNTIA